ncbi:DUF1961 family protein [Hyunsoonleella pacifica]|uniref:DUF1961 family protein n=1 Tax=Hyunsoonleella pacifica TaxID=1080224 RepID=A0A4Q9FRS2_9FLAO|nr:DUF1961 family protein [Hyunsoonleella pacifica]TBN18788.1 DUF1961 family protein [Hyunsoonleella pacifica]GGD04743.1 hypothetical protein GCM10011368_03220 [Hyunsoonleella pacifica]
MMRSFFVLIFICFTACKTSKTTHSLNKRNTPDWSLVFNDSCTQDWTKNWTLDGLIATVENSKKGMHFKAGSEAYNDAHHAVLWTKKSYSGDVKIEFDYTKTDDENRFVNILYIQATGDKEGIHEKDISKWNKKREVPAMRKYFENMNVFHISYAAFGNKGDGFYYVRARRYPKPNNKSFNSTRIAPSFDKQGFFEKGKTYHITAVKTESMLSFKMENEGNVQTFKWDISKVKPIQEGRIGIRHMYRRSAIYKNFKIYTR